MSNKLRYKVFELRDELVQDGEISDKSLIEILLDMAYTLDALKHKLGEKNESDD